MTGAQLIKDRMAQLGADFTRVAAFAGIPAKKLGAALDDNEPLTVWEAVRLAHTLGLLPTQVLTTGTERELLMAAEHCGLRDQLAMAALADLGGRAATPEAIARDAYLIADAMLAERLK